MKKAIRQQAEEMGHSVVGSLKRIKNDVWYDEYHDKAVCQLRYIDDEETVYVIEEGIVAYIAGETFVI